MLLVSWSKYKAIILLIFVSLMSVVIVFCYTAFKPVEIPQEESIIVSAPPEPCVEEADANDTMKKYVQLDNQEDMQLIKNIESNTPLDFDTSCIIISYARKFNIKPSLILAMIDLESNFNQFSVGTHEDRGYLQIIPPTEKWLIEEFGEELDMEYDPERIFEPEYNIGLGTAYISLLSSAYGDNINRILSEYNRGPYNLKKFYEKHKTYETSYSRSILKREKKYEHFNE
ncbi:MAG: transglycosylase SLT domain-containing protein [Clostridia bacterium]|nr:transglycosylase SLT domain-containing protein [Clostridia bacterium]